MLDLTRRLEGIYHETAHEVGHEPGPENFGYLMRVLVADTEGGAQEIGRTFPWTEAHRNLGPVQPATRRDTSTGKPCAST